MNKVVETKASAEATPPGNSQPQPAENEKDRKTDTAETTTVADTLDEVQEQAHPFN